MTEAALCARPINAAQTAVSGHASQAMAKPGKESVAVLRKAWYAIDEDARYQPAAWRGWVRPVLTGNAPMSCPFLSRQFVGVGRRGWCTAARWTGAR